LHASRVLWLALLLAMLQRQNLELKYNLLRWSVVDQLDRSGFLHLASGSVYVVLELTCMSGRMEVREEVLCAYVGVDLPPVGLGNYGCDWFRRFPVTYTHRHTMWQCNDNLSTADDIGHKFGSIACAHRMNLREWTVTSI
jgi:hypothetical protein